MGMTTLCYIEQDNRLLMMHRIIKKNDINKDKWIGVGGHFEHGESPEECLLREVKEETGLRLTSYRFCGLVTFISDMDTDKEAIEYMCLYHADGFEGSVGDDSKHMAECNEGVLKWVPKEDVFNLDLWEGDKLFLRYMDEGRKFFSLKLKYVDGRLIEAVLDGEEVGVCNDEKN